MTKTKTLTFKQLVHNVREDWRKEGEPPVEITELARLCRVSRAYFYFLMDGTRTPSDHVVERIVTVLERAKSTVTRALAASRKAVG